ncbi:hypothetical protein SUGI_0176450 [Cryptomeria japonica]|uniref:uncharacterized protein LOC131052194 n=1 Tax=Cryptomeria japonica TaxID=3369 RepID=UPI002408CCF6|nr:uncharacterized protein LOC131052194 [Cryptomeria japonica]XP_057842795.2 uncharacterized protein LOC131052194 [Cryptomeria japonica]GLJ11767.1 hypothetical protein SUGI_0176450 [Cryptomeria japonica]
MTELNPNFWLPSNVLSDDDDDEQSDALLTPRGVAAFETEAAQEVAGSNSPKSTVSSGSSPSCSQRERGSDSWDLLDGAAMKLKVNEVNWSKDFHAEWSSANNINSNEGKGNAFTTWNSTNFTENSTIPASQLVQEKLCPVRPGWCQQTKLVQNQSTRIVDHSYPPWAFVQGAGSGMKAVFLESNGSSRESGGTGVFLPRRAGNIIDSKKKKKPGFSTVLLPYRVVQALNLTIQNMNVQSPVRDLDKWKNGFICGRKIENNNRLSGNEWSDQQKEPFHSVNSNNHALSPEISLPQDWTY